MHGIFYCPVAHLPTCNGFEAAIQQRIQWQPTAHTHSQHVQQCSVGSCRAAYVAETASACWFGVLRPVMQPHQLTQSHEPYAVTNIPCSHDSLSACTA